MKAPSTKIRFAEAQKLLDYGFSNYSYTSFIKKDSTLTTLPVEKGTSNLVDVIFEEDMRMYSSKRKRTRSRANNNSTRNSISTY